MDLGALETVLKTGRIGTIVATLGTTGLGAVDPLADIIPLAKQYDARVHVDTAYGGFFALIPDELDADTARHYAAIPQSDSIVVDPRNARHVTVAVSCGGVWQTHDGGAHWTLTANGMTADYLPEGSTDDGNTQDPHALVQCAAHPDVLWVQHHCGIYRSTDGGLHWTGIAAPAPSGPATRWDSPGSCSAADSTPCLASTD